MSSNTKPRFIFVSHAGEDTWVARQIAREISARGAHPFLDEADVDVGAEFEEDILAFLEKADELVVLFTPWALKRPYVWAEIGAAWIRRIPIIVVLHGLLPKDLHANPNAPVFLKKRDIIRLNDVGQYFEQLGTRVAAEKTDGREA
jgi:TIR domain